MKQIFFFPLLLLIFLLCEPVFAYTSEGYVESGDSVKSKFSIGSQPIGSNYNYFIDVNATNQSSLSGQFKMINNLQVSEGQTATGYFHFALDHCKTGTSSTLSIYSSYYNYVDYSYNLGTTLYLAEGDYARSTCYRSFIRLRLEYYQELPRDEGGIYVIFNKNNNFATYNGNSYGILLRYTDLVYLSESDYNLLLESAKNGQANIDIRSDLNNLRNSINSVKDSVDSVNDSVNDVNDSVNAVNDSINNSDTTQANSTGSSWFSNFRVDSTRGFSSIITAPIRLIQGILNGSSSCSPLSFDVSLKHNSTTQSNEVSLPCGGILWNNVPNTAVLLYHSTIFGLFAWFVLSDMYKFIDNIRDPDDKTEFIMKL